MRFSSGQRSGRGITPAAAAPDSCLNVLTRREPHRKAFPGKGVDMNPIVRRIVATLTITAAPFLLVVGVATANTEPHQAVSQATHQVTHVSQN
ncbi:hypothetical protein KZ781_04800 [Mycolicibacterium smegmatis]|nr:hypothetical protein K8P01_22785 [Mycolicibacterium smegmatis]ULN30055.1 hypothetical protein KZ780_05570 [Mycolicibacterium smegmatis]ULN36380.1 hypothetical protein KZ781_04800 [Mycolicibacterium smegmatis]ULN71470.1 hypothetical protein KZ782_05970 [Mycolicibacterium smegmatis]